MSETYEIGGIFQALQSVPATTTPGKKLKKKNEAENDDSNSDHRKNTLSSLFAKQDTEKPVSFSEQDIKDYINKELYQDDESELESDSEVPGNNRASSDGGRKAKKKVKLVEDPERLARTVFVGNVSVNVTKKMLKKLFRKFGEIESVRIRSVPCSDPKLPKKVALIKKEFHPERDNMSAYIVFKSLESANESLACHGRILKDLHLRVDKCDKKEHDHKSCIFVGNLPFACSEEAVRNHFKDCGAIDDVRIIRDKATGLGKGFGYIKFENTDSVMFGLKLNNSTFDNRKLRVYRSKENPSATGSVRNKDQRQYGGLRVTSKKDLEKGRKIFGSMKNSKKSNALQRIKNKHQKQARNKERNLNRKSGKIKK